MATKTVTEEKVNTNTTIDEKLEIKPPKNFKIILYNNHVTLHALVKEVLSHVFGIQGTKAFVIMRSCEAQGIAIVMTGPEDITKKKTQEAMEYKEVLAATYEGNAQDMSFDCQPMD